MEKEASRSRQAKTAIPACLSSQKATCHGDAEGQAGARRQGCAEETVESTVLSAATPRKKIQLIDIEEAAWGQHEPAGGKTGGGCGSHGRSN